MHKTSLKTFKKPWIAHTTTTNKQTRPLDRHPIKNINIIVSLQSPCQYGSAIYFRQDDCVTQYNKLLRDPYK